MKFAAKKWYNYLIIVGLGSLLFLGAYLPYKLAGGNSWPLKYVFYTLIFGGVALGLIGFIAQDLYRASVRHRINDWDNNLDEKYINKAWMIFYPLLVTGFISLLIGIFLIFLIK